jgi:hypothetical protein
MWFTWDTTSLAQPKELLVKRQDFDAMFKTGEPTDVLSKARGVRGRPRSD